jgi:hypothetical protein
MSQETEKLPESVCAILVICGTVLLGAGMVTLLYAAVTVYQVMHNPADVPFVHMLQEKITLSELGIYGKTAEGREFEFKGTEPVRYVIFFWLGLLSLSIMVRIFSGLVSLGGQLLKMGAEGRAEKRPDTVS